MKYQELVKLSPEELAIRAAGEKAQLDKMRFAHAINPLEKPHLLRQSRRLIARIRTAIAYQFSHAEVRKES